MFNKMDTDKDGIVTIEELKAGLRNFGTQLAESEVQMLIEAVDTKGKGTLDYGEFVAVSLHLQKVANDEHLRKAFSYFDKDGNGYILPEELCEALKEDGGDDSVDVANDIFQEVDTDKFCAICLISNKFEFTDLQIGWENKLRRVCGNDENRNGLEKGVSSLLEREIQ
ncbi:hypothetical protein F2Q70_00040734 [Brassica cretica]|uniref:EF-hand domain-containing protein n=1 Tax=Brassica cretica TaxID=69181 RepID=A0A8S9KA39_BRACR|nr:hypothetical protein F2Q70_00040734 [Brassica cretica]